MICAEQGTIEKSPSFSAFAPYMMSTKRGSMYADQPTRQHRSKQRSNSALPVGVPVSKMAVRFAAPLELCNVQRPSVWVRIGDPTTYLVLYHCPLMMMASM